MRKLVRLSKYVFIGICVFICLLSLFVVIRSRYVTDRMARITLGDEYSAEYWIELEDGWVRLVIMIGPTDWISGYGKKPINEIVVTSSRRRRHLPWYGQHSRNPESAWHVAGIGFASGELLPERISKRLYVMSAFWPLGLSILAMGVVGRSLMLEHRRAQRILHGRCVACGYLLIKGQMTCSECGQTVQLPKHLQRQDPAER